MRIDKKSTSHINAINIKFVCPYFESPGYFLFGLYLTSLHKVIHFKLKSKESLIQKY